MTLYIAQCSINFNLNNLHFCIFDPDVDPECSDDNLQSELTSSYLMAVYEPVIDEQRGKPHSISVVVCMCTLLGLQFELKHVPL